MIQELVDTVKTNNKQSSASAEAGANLIPLAPEMAKDLVQLFKLLSDETRLRILTYLLQTEELNVRTLCELLGQSQPAVSHHLALLRVAGLIESRRDGKHNFYHLLPSRIESVLKQVFATLPNQARKVRFNEHVLTFQPVGG